MPQGLVTVTHDPEFRHFVNIACASQFVGTYKIQAQLCHLKAKWTTVEYVGLSDLLISVHYPHAD